jgi:hypothetical protein
MKILAFCMAYRLESETIEALVRQQGVKSLDLMICQDNPHLGEERGQYRNMMMNWQKMEQIARTRNYDKVWLAEADNIQPPDALAKLLEVDAPVVTGLFASRYPPYRPNLWEAPGITMEWPRVMERWGQTIEVGGSGTGCMLIDGSVLQNYSIDMYGYHNPMADNVRQQIDQLFCTYCFKNHVKMMARLDVLVGHKFPNGDVIWPDEKTRYRIEQN